MAFIAALLIKEQPTPIKPADSPIGIARSFALLKNKKVLMMVVGLFLYVGAEVGMNSWLATFLFQNHQLDLSKLATIGIGFFFTALLIGRFVGAIVLNWLKPQLFFIFTSILSILGLLIFLWAGKLVAVAAIFIIGLGFANIFPLIFSILINDMPAQSDPLSGLMVMAIVGGAVMPFMMGILADFSMHYAFFIPLLSMVYILWVAIKTNTSQVRVS
jgi:fucose permease